MDGITIIQFPAVASDDSFRQLRTAAQSRSSSFQFTLGTHVQDKNTAQVTAEWNSKQAAGSTAEKFQGLTSLLNVETTSTNNVLLNRPAFGPAGAGTFKIIEFVESTFAASRATPELRKKIEQDFFQFESIYTRDGIEGSTPSFGWTVEERAHVNVEDEKILSFIVMRGWDSMPQFEKSLKTTAFKEAIPILLYWKAPFKMWHVQQAE